MPPPTPQRSHHLSNRVGPSGPDQDHVTLCVGKSTKGFYRASRLINPSTPNQVGLSIDGDAAVDFIRGLGFVPIVLFRQRVIH